MSSIGIICAVSKNNVIGIDGKLPWNISADLRRFRELTMGKTIIMGRKTYESIGRPLPGRRNIIMSRSAGYNIDGCITVKNMDDAINSAIGDIMIIGGYEIYKQFLHLAQKIYMTIVDCDIYGNNIVLFPPLDDSWNIVTEERYKGTPDYSFMQLSRNTA